MAEAQRPIRIANCSGFYGDRLAAARELLDGPEPIDVLTGDYLAELTMFILWKARQKDPEGGYALTFVRQMEDVLADCLAAGIRIVTNAGGLNPAGLARSLQSLGARLGVAPRIAVVTGDDLLPQLDRLQAAGHEFRHLDNGRPLSQVSAAPLTANAYIGGWGIAAALDAGADMVVCGRVADASLAVGPAAWWHGWARDDWDCLAGAVVAGHIIECGPQATGGNYSFPDELAKAGLPGFPIAEIAADGSSVITKQPGTAGGVTTGTVTAQLLYEVAAPRYLSPDVTARLDTVTLREAGEDRVAVIGARGEPAPADLKVAITLPAGYRNAMTVLLTGLDIESKASQVQTQLLEALGGLERFDEIDLRLVRTDREDADQNELATAQLRIAARGQDRSCVGRGFSNAVMELALSGCAGFFTTTPPSDATAIAQYWPTLVPAHVVQERVLLPDGGVLAVPPGPRPSTRRVEDPLPPRVARPVHADTTRAPLGVVCGARSGDKGGNANVGLWARSGDAFEWLVSYLTVARFQELLPEAQDLSVDRFELPNLRALNFVVTGLLGDGVASSDRFDPQAKGLGEYLRSRIVDVPRQLLGRTAR